MEELTEQQKIARIKLEGMKTICASVGVDFKPVLNKVKELINTNAPKEEIIKEIDSLLGLIAQMERFSNGNREEK